MVLALFALAGYSQHADSIKVHLNHYTLTLGTGWTHYINNLEYGNQHIRQDFAGVSLKFFWEPEYRLSLGLESGYYHLFQVKDQLTPDLDVRVDRTIVPLLLLVRMRIIDNVYIAGGMGLASLTNRASGGTQTITTHVWSYSNYELSASYIYPLGKHWRLGGEAKMFEFGSLDDWMYSLQIFCGLRF